MTEREELLEEIEQLKRQIPGNAPFEEYVYVHCFHCDSKVAYEKRDIRQILTAHRTMGASWWTCPVCGIKEYIEDVMRRSKLYGLK